MPLITIINHGKTDNVDVLALALRRACLNVRELELSTDNQVTVVLGGRQIIGGSAQKLLVEVNLLFDRPKRTKEVRDHLAKQLFATVKNLLGPTRLVEVAIVRFDPRVESFASD